MRKAASLTIALSFIVLIITSIVLYIVPHGRVAYWADWHMWGLSKTQWGEMHINSGVLFCLAGFAHIYCNWKAMLSYMRKSKKMRVFTKDFNIALGLTILTIGGTYFYIPPFSWVLDLGEVIKESATERYGSPPYGHAELSSIKTLSQRMGLDADKCLDNLKKVGIQVESIKSTIITISEDNDLTPQEVYDIAKGKDEPPSVDVCSPAKHGSLPQSGSGGFGKMTIEDICVKHSISKDQANEYLVAKGIAYSKGEKVKDIATRNKLDPYSIYEIITGK